MSKDNKINLEVEMEDGTKKKVFIRKPSGKVLADSQRVSAKVWTDCVREKIMTKQELKNFMYENNIWNRAKDLEQVVLSEDIQNLEKKLYTGGGEKQMKASEAKNIAIEMRVQRMKLRDLIAQKMELEQNTAEALADNAKFDFIVSRSTFYENGDPVYKDVEDYSINSDGPIAYAAATAMAELMYSLDKNFEANLPENKFLKDQHLVNDDLSLIDNDGNMVDTEGRRINELGHYINDEGKRTDLDGNLLDDDGNYVPSVTYIDDIHEETAKAESKPKPKRTRKKATPAKPSS